MIISFVSKNRWEEAQVPRENSRFLGGDHHTLSYSMVSGEKREHCPLCYLDITHFLMVNMFIYLFHFNIIVIHKKTGDYLGKNCYLQPLKKNLSQLKFRCKKDIVAL